MNFTKLVLAALVGSGLLMPRLATQGSLNIATVFLVRAQVGAESVYRPVASRWLVSVAENDGASSLSAAMHLWSLAANQGDCRSALLWGQRLLTESEGERRLDTQPKDNLLARFCLWSMYENAGRQFQADMLKHELQFFDARVLEISQFRQIAVMAAPRLVREGIWSLDLSHRVLSYALGFTAETDLVRQSAQDLAVAFPDDAYLQYLIAVSEMAKEQRQDAERSLRRAHALIPQSFQACVLDLHGTSLEKLDRNALLWFNPLDGRPTQGELNRGWVGGENFWESLYTWQYDQVIRTEGAASLRITGIWVQPDSQRESSRVGMAIRLPALPAGSLRLQFDYRTDPLSESETRVRVTRSSTIYNRWFLPSTNGCWQHFDAKVDWLPDPRGEIIIVQAGVGDVWVDRLSIERAVAP